MSGLPDASRRNVVVSAVLGISSVALPGAGASASGVRVSGWSTTLTFSAVATDGFTVAWDAVG